MKNKNNGDCYNCEYVARNAALIDALFTARPCMASYSKELSGEHKRNVLKRIEVIDDALSYLQDCEECEGEGTKLIGMMRFSCILCGGTGKSMLAKHTK